MGQYLITFHSLTKGEFNSTVEKKKFTLLVSNVSMVFILFMTSDHFSGKLRKDEKLKTYPTLQRSGGR